MDGTISIEIIVGIGVVCGVIVGAVAYIRSQAGELVLIHNENASAHEDMREEIKLVHRRIDEHEKRFEQYIADHNLFVEKKTNEIIDAIKGQGNK